MKATDDPSVYWHRRYYVCRCQAPNYACTVDGPKPPTCPYCGNPIKEVAKEVYEDVINFLDVSRATRMCVECEQPAVPGSQLCAKHSRENKQYGRMSDVTVLAGVPFASIRPATVEEVRLEYAERVSAVILEVATQEPALYWRAGDKIYLDDPLFGDVVAIDDLGYGHTLGLFDRRIFPDEKSV